MNNDSAILSARQLRKYYRLGTETIEVLRGVKFDVVAGECVAILGASGSGKSTLLHIIGGLDQPDQGQLLCDGQDLFSLSSRRRNQIRNRKIGFVFQFYHLLPELSVVENVIIPTMVTYTPLGWWGGQRSKVRLKAKKLLDDLGMSHRLLHRPSQLSGGERQRVAIARALINSPPILLADEPTGNLDRKSGEIIINTLLALNKQSGQTLVIVTHDPNVAACADRQLELVDGRLRDN